MKESKHLPIFGVGPLYVITIFIITGLFLTLNYLNLLDSGIFKVLKIPFIILAVLLILIGIIMWILAVFKVKIDKQILENKLATNGIYGLSRNPIYAAFLIINSGILLITYNLYLLILPFFYYLFLTVLLIHTEEKWCLDKFGAEYISYMKKVNRIIPLPKIKKIR